MVSASLSESLREPGRFHRTWSAAASTSPRWYASETTRPDRWNLSSLLAGAFAWPPGWGAPPLSDGLLVKMQEQRQWMVG
jgi:hypothetical protein